MTGASTFTTLFVILIDFDAAFTSIIALAISFWKYETRANTVGAATLQSFENQLVIPISFVVPFTVATSGAPVSPVHPPA